MIYDWNFRIWIEQYLPAMLRRTKRVALHYAMLTPFRRMYLQFLEHREGIEFLAKYSSETLAVEHLLNTLYDPSLKRIQIITNDDTLQRLYAFRRNEIVEPAKKIYAYRRSETISEDKRVYYYRRPELVAVIDVTVKVPLSVYVTYGASIRRTFERYKLAGATYEVRELSSNELLN